MALKIIGSAKLRPFRNIWMLKELDVPFEHVPVFPHTTEAKSHNPYGKVPSLVDDDLILYESAAINTYLGDKFRPGTLVPPPGTPLRGLYEQCVHHISSELDAQGLWVHRKYDKDKGLAKIGMFPALPEAVEDARKHACRVTQILGALLCDNGGKYLLGDEFGFSAADVLFVHCLDWAQAIGWLDDSLDGADGEKMGGKDGKCDVGPTLRSYLERCRSRPAYKSAKKCSEMEKGLQRARL